MFDKDKFCNKIIVFDSVPFEISTRFTFVDKYYCKTLNILKIVPNKRNLKIIAEID